MENARPPRAFSFAPMKRRRAALLVEFRISQYLSPLHYCTAPGAWPAYAQKRTRANRPGFDELSRWMMVWIQAMAAFMRARI
jgi:hypothetical protein